MNKKGRGRAGVHHRPSGGGDGFFQEIVDAVRSSFDRLSFEPADDSLNALDLLKAQHRGVEKLFAELEDASGDRKSALFAELADLLAVHAAIEERIFYPNVKMEATEALLKESVQEHLHVKRMVAELMETSVSDDSFDPKILLLKDMVEHHAKDEEERKLFPILRRELAAEWLEGLGSEMIALMVELQRQPQPPRAAIPSQTEEAAPI